MAEGEKVGVKLGPALGEGDSAGVGKAKVGEITGVGETVGDSLGEGRDVEVGVAVGDGVAVGVGDGVGVGVGTMSFQRYKGTLAPPISSTSFSQRARIFSRSGGPNGRSAVSGKMR